MADDFEDWEHVAAGVGETTGNPVDKDAVQLELELLLDEGLVNAFAVSSSGTEGRLVWTDPDRSHLREEWTYWFHPTESGMRFYCDATGAPFPTEQFTLEKLTPPEEP